ncbi:MAG: transporter ATP-binding protein [Flavipsychrobacter sp.]|jgi:ABC-type multidrug transport system ATPase subunit|nr:transporter ATP-binding protein [Flavipsychrobacter sp.]
MTISLENIGKRFQRYWIFKDVTYTFNQPEAYALLGPNGCGKSTLLRIIAGMQAPSKGKVHIKDANGQPTEISNIFSQTSFCAPGMELVEELTLREFLNFHFSFKRPLNGLAINDIIEIIGLKNAADKQVGDYSSGMKQRVKLAQAIFVDTPILLLDEPCTNLDQAGVEQYHNWIEHYAKGRLVIVASNDEREYFFCKEMIEIQKYKSEP